MLLKYVLRIMLRFVLPGVVMFAISIHHAAAQNESIVPDRPGFSTGTFTVPVGEIYIETGYLYSFRNRSNLRFSNIPELNIRTGLSKRAELFVEWSGAMVDHKNNETDQEWPVLGGKYRLSQSESFELTLIGSLSAGKEDGSLRADPLFGLMWETELADGFTQFGGLQIESDEGVNKRHWFPSLALGVEYEIWDNISLVTEFYSIYDGVESTFLPAIEGAILFFPRTSVQLDLHGGIGLSNEIPHYAGVGLSFRI